MYRNEDTTSLLGNPAQNAYFEFDNEKTSKKY